MKNSPAISIADLKSKEKSLKNILVVFSVIYGLIVVSSVLLTVMQGFSVFSVFPIVFIGTYIPMVVNLKKVRKEIAEKNNIDTK